jgi:Uma2 family endonuclease
MGNIVISDRLRIPGWVDDFSAFRRWIRSEHFPDHGWYSHLAGELWVDVSMEKVWHNQIKGVIAIVVGGLVLAARLGKYFHDRMFLSNLDVGLSTEPDGMFVSRKALKSGRVALLEGKESLEVIGTPDMVLEVVSPTTVHKDTVVMREQYWQAGIAEYWLIRQGQGQNFDLAILRHTEAGYVANRVNRGWVKSKVFGKAFRLAEEADDVGGPTFLLDSR